MRRNVTDVTVSAPVDGSRPRKRRTVRRSPNQTTEHVIVRGDVMAAARKAMRPGQRIVIVSATCVEIVNR